MALSKSVDCDDGTESDEYLHFFNTAKIVCGLVVFPALCIPGLIGNIFALIVFSHKDMRTPTNVYLVFLAVSDIIKLLNDLLYSIIVAVSLADPAFGELLISAIYPVAHYIFHLSSSLTAWFTVSVATVRYLYVCHPHRAKLTVQTAWIVSMCLFALITVINLPSALRYAMHKDRNQTCVTVVLTPLGQNKVFTVTYSWLQSSLRAYIPMIILIYLTSCIIKELWKERAKGKKLSSRNSITLKVLVVVALFMLCLTPDAVMSTVFGKGYVEEGNLVRGIREITDSLLTLNSASNFFIFISMSVHFRTTFQQIFCRCAPKNNKERVATGPGAAATEASVGSASDINDIASSAFGDNTAKGRRENYKETYL